MNLSSSISNSCSPAHVKTINHADTLATAIDFVLALEHPCMSHIPYQDPPSADPANHMMMASTPLMARAPDPPQFNSTWTASGATIKALLNLSSSINLEGEITPVEAWHRLYDHPDFWKLNRDQIENLKRELSTAVQCCGYVQHNPLLLPTSYPALIQLHSLPPTRIILSASTFQLTCVLDSALCWMKMCSGTL